MAHQIHVPEPCHEDWDNMLPETNGRHCLQCCKTVVDFTGWEVEAIANYLRNAKSSTCGRFTSDQVQAPAQPQPEELAPYVIRATMPLYRKLAAIIVLFFGLSFSSEAQQRSTGGPVVALPAHMGDTVLAQPPVAVMGATPVPVPVVVPDTPAKHLVMGKMVMPKKEVKGRVAPLPKPKPKTKPAPQPPRHLQGDVQIVEPPAPQQSQSKE